jgi:hypothetical protein
MPDNKLKQLDDNFDALMAELDKDAEKLEADKKEENVEEVKPEPVEEDTKKVEDESLGDTTFSVKEETKPDKDAAAFKQMREERSRLKKELEEKEKVLEEFTKMSRASGFGNVEELLDEWRNQQIKKEAESKGVPADVLKQIDEQKRRLEKLEREKNELEQKSKQQTVVKQIDSIVAELKLSTQEADALIDTMGKDGVTWEQLLVLPPAAISNAVRGYATPIVLERERQALIKKTQSKDEFQEEKIAEKRQRSVKKDEFSRESLEKEIAAYRKKNFPHLK